MELGVALAVLGALLLLALVADWVAERTPLPRVSTLLLLGVLVGPAGFGLLPDVVLAGEELATTVALAIIGFLLGTEFHRHRLRSQGHRVLAAAVVGALVTAVVVGSGLIVGGWSVTLALALAGIATATAPAATRSVITDERADGPTTRTLLGIIAIDDAVGIVLFSVLVAVGAVVEGDAETAGLLSTATREIGGGIALGVVVGVPSALLARRLPTGDPIFLQALAVVLLVSGLGHVLDVSLLLAAVVAGATVVNLAGEDHQRPFQALEGVQWPFLAVFFIFGGAALRWEGVTAYTALTLLYVGLRLVGKVGGGYLAGAAAGLDPRGRRWLGPALLPQAGVALGLALLTRERFPELAEVIVPVVVVSTVAFEFAGPIATRTALHRTGEAGRAEDSAGQDAETR